MTASPPSYPRMPDPCRLRSPRPSARDSAAHGRRSQTMKTTRCRSSPAWARSTLRCCTSASPGGSPRRAFRHAPHSAGPSCCGCAGRLRKTSRTLPSRPTARERNQRPQTHGIAASRAGWPRTAHRQTREAGRWNAPGASGQPSRSSRNPPRLSSPRACNPFGRGLAGGSAWSRPSRHHRERHTRCLSWQCCGAFHRGLWWQAGSKGPTQ
mmetsp:Transcript_98477/g.287191  ORF Transcript_98477/g.287191 Transcript_98477/m.287191 type:complete len:210 (-) Transcript_98477:1950-2579(-)